MKAGWIANLFPWGPTAFAVDYQAAHDVDAVGDDFQSYGAFIVQHISHVGTEIYAGLRNHSLNIAGAANPDDIWGFMTGARVKF